MNNFAFDKSHRNWISFQVFTSFAIYLRGKEIDRYTQSDVSIAHEIINRRLCSKYTATWSASRTQWNHFPRSEITYDLLGSWNRFINIRNPWKTFSFYHKATSILFGDADMLAKGYRFVVLCLCVDTWFVYQLSWAVITNEIFIGVYSSEICQNLYVVMYKERSCIL